MQFQVEFYETEEGRIPTQDFLDSLEPKMSAKMVSLMEILEEEGLSLREPYTSLLQSRIVITHGFLGAQKSPGHRSHWQRSTETIS